MDLADEANVASVSSLVQQVQRILNATNGSGDGLIAINRQLPTARSAMILLDATTFMDQSDRIAEQSFIISELQRLAYHDQDSGGVQDIAEWCVAQWLRILQHSPESIETLQGELSCSLATMTHLTPSQDWARPGLREHRLHWREFIAKKEVPRVAVAVPDDQAPAAANPIQ